MNKKILVSLVVIIILGIIFIGYNLLNKNKVKLTSEDCFIIDKEKNEITEYKDICGTEVNIPSEIDGTIVESIGRFVFANKGLKKIVLPDTVKVIGIGAFQDNEIDSLIIPDSVENVKALSFKSNKIEKLKIGKGVKNIGDKAFNDNLVKDKNEAFIFMRNDDGIVDDILVGYAGKEKDNVVIPDNVTMLYLSALAECKITGIKLNNKLERIESSALENNNLTSITIPKNVIIIGSGVFDGNINLEKIIVKGKKSIEDFALFDTTNLDKEIIEFN